MASLGNFAVGSDSDSSKDTVASDKQYNIPDVKGLAITSDAAPTSDTATIGPSAAGDGAVKERKDNEGASGLPPGGRAEERESPMNAVSSSATPTAAEGKTGKAAPEGGKSVDNANTTSSETSRERTPRGGVEEVEQEKPTAVEENALEKSAAPPLDLAAVQSKRSSIKPSPAAKSPVATSPAAQTAATTAAATVPSANEGPTAKSPAFCEGIPNAKGVPQPVEGAESKTSRAAGEHKAAQLKERPKHADVINGASLKKEARKGGASGTPRQVAARATKEPSESPLLSPPRVKTDCGSRGTKGHNEGRSSAGKDGAESVGAVIVDNHQVPVIDIPAPSVHQVFHTNKGNDKGLTSNAAGAHIKEKRIVAEGGCASGRVKTDGKENSPRVSPLTLKNIGRHVREFEGTRKGYTARMCHSSESSLFKSCVSLVTGPGGASKKKRGARRRVEKPMEATGRALQKLDIPAYHRRLILDMHQRGISERYAGVESDIDDWLHTTDVGRRYSLSPEECGGMGGHDRLPQRRYRSTVDGNFHGYRSRGASDVRLPERRRLERGGRGGREEYPYKPVISKFAKTLPRSDVPCHERLYSARPSVQRNKEPRLEDEEATPLTPRMQEFVDNSSFKLFQPHITKRAKAVEVEAPFYDRLHPSKEELARRRPEEPKPVTPRVPTSRTPLPVSARLLSRPTAPPPESLPSFRPMITTRAKGVEYSKPFYDRLHPSKEQRERKRKDEESKKTPPRASPRRVASVSQRLLEPHQPPPYEKYDPSFRPEISPRARALEREGPFHKRLYLTPFELEEAHAVYLRRHFENSCNFPPEIAERVRHSCGSKKVRRGSSKPVRAHRERS